MAYYDLKKKPALTTKEGEEEVLYAQAVTAGTISSEKFLDLVSKRGGFGRGQIEGVLMSVFETAADWINQGYSVEIGRFGFFTGKVKGGRMVRRKTDIRAQSIHFNDVNFRPSAVFKNALDGELTRVPSIGFRQSSALSMDELERRLMGYLDEHAYISRVTYSELTGRLKWKATQDLQAFVDKGLIVACGSKNQKRYVRAK